MAISISFNGVTYSIPETGDESWGESLTAFFVAIPQGVLQKTGGNFTLTNDINFGPNFGLISKYFTSRSPDPAQTGVLRLAVGDSIGWRDNANAADLLLGINASDELIFQGVPVTSGGITALTGDVLASGPGVAVATIAPNAVTNSKFRQSAALSVVGNATDLMADIDDIIALSDFTVLRRNGALLEFGLISGDNIDPAASIPYSKLDLTDSIVNSDVNSAAAIAYSKLNLTGSIVNGDISPLAAIDYSKLNLTNSIVNADVSPTAAIAYSKLNLAGSIVNGDVSPTASIARSKLAAGTPFRIAANNVSGVLAENAAITASRAVVSDANGQLLASTTTAAEIGLVSGVTSGIQTQLDAKIDKAVLSAAGSMIYGSAPSTPATLLAGSSGQVLKMIGTLPTWSSFSGGINYISTNPDAEADTSGWLTYLNTASNIPVTGSGGVPNSTWTRTTSSPLRSTASFLWSKTGTANRQGEGVAFAFTLDSADRAKVLAIQFDYIVNSGIFTASNGSTPPLNDGTTTTNAGNSDLEVFIYDVTNAILIPVSPQVFVSNSATIPATYKGIFQSSATGTSYRLIIHTATAVTNNYTVKFDNFYLGPDTTKALQGPAVTDTGSTAWTPTGTWTTNTTYTGRWFRQGDRLRAAVEVNLTGAPNAATNLTLNLPPGLSIDPLKITSTNANTNYYGTGGGVTAGTGRIPFQVRYLSTTSVSIVWTNAGAATFVATASPVAWGNGDSLGVEFDVPIAGWSSTSQMSNDTDTRVVAASYNPSANTASNPLLFNTRIIDTHAGMNASGVYTVPVSGIYVVSIVNIASAGSGSITILKNGALYSGICYATTTNFNNGSLEISCNAGDTLSVGNPNGVTLFGGTPAGNNAAIFSLYKLSGPATIAASEKIIAKYFLAGVVSFSSTQPINFATKAIDTHGAVTIGASWRFTAPRSDYFRVSVTLGAASTTTLNIHKNGVAESSLTTVTAAAYYSGAQIVQLNAGDYMEIRGDAGAINTLGATLQAVSINSE